MLSSSNKTAAIVASTLIPVTEAIVHSSFFFLVLASISSQLNLSCSHCLSIRKGRWLWLWNLWKLNTPWKLFPLETGKMDEGDFNVEIWAILLPSKVILKPSVNKTMFGHCLNGERQSRPFSSSSTEIFFITVSVATQKSLWVLQSYNL